MSRYLNTATLKQETESNADNIIDSDSRVKNWFKSKPDGFKGEWIDGTYTFVEIPLPTQAEIDAKAYAQAKQDKVLAVSQITVTTTSDKVFDGGEVSQNRMGRAVTASSAGDTTQWILADNTQATVTHEELKEALLLSGEAMTAIWMA